MKDTDAITRERERRNALLAAEMREALNPRTAAPVVPQPLTDEDIHLITGHCGVSKHAAISIARAVEAEVLKRMGVAK